MVSPVLLDGVFSDFKTLTVTNIVIDTHTLTDVGPMVGSNEGVGVPGLDDGLMVGLDDGIFEGFIVGDGVGLIVGLGDGIDEGCIDGWDDG